MERLSFFTKTAYGVGQVAEGVKNVCFASFLLFYYNQVLGLPGTLAGLALFIATTFDAVTDPLAGSISDRFRHRWGRRHPFMYASAIPLGISFALVFDPPDGLGETGLFLWLTAFAVLVRASMTLYHVPHLALGAELSQDYEERTTVVSFRTAFGLLGFAGAIAAAWTVFFRETPAYPDGQFNPEAYPALGAIGGLVMVVTILASAAGTHGRIPLLHRPPEAAEAFGPRLLWRQYRTALSNASFRGLFVGLVVFFVMRGVQDVLAIHMATFFWGLKGEQIRALQLAAIPGLILGVPFWTVVAKRFDKKPAFLLGIGFFSAFVVIPPVAKIYGFFPPYTSPAYLSILALAMALGAFSVVAGLVTAGSMMADIADEHELATGLRQEGLFFGALAFAVKASSGLGTFVAGVGLDAISFPTNALPGSVPPATVDSLAFLYGPGIGGLAVVAVAFLAQYRITRRRHREIAEELARRHAARDWQAGGSS
jgi:Na+/melibiose symporter-like transporter